MFHLVAILAIATIVVGVPSTINTNGNCLVASTKFDIVKNITKIESMYPNAKITKLEKHDDGRGNIGYTLGDRIDGDKVVCVGSNSAHWSSAKDARLNILYPHTQPGDVITFIKIDIRQSRDDLEVYIVSGGIGQREILLLIVADGTTFFEWALEVFAY